MLKHIYILTDSRRYSPNRIGGGESYIRRLVEAGKKCNVYFVVLLIHETGSAIDESLFASHRVFQNVDDAYRFITKENAEVILFNLGWRYKLKFIFYDKLYLLNLFYPSTTYVMLGRIVELLIMNYKSILVPSIRLKKFFEKMNFNVYYLPPIITDHYMVIDKIRIHKYGFIGRLDPRKGVQKIFDAINLDVIGNVYISYIKHDGDPGVSDLETQLFKSGCKFREVPQQFYSLKVEDELLYELNDIQVFLQIYENLDSTVDLPLLLLEALACGCFVITNINFEELNLENLLIDFNGISDKPSVSSMYDSELDRLKSSALVHEKFGFSEAQNRILEYFDEKNIP